MQEDYCYALRMLKNVLTTACSSTGAGFTQLPMGIVSSVRLLNDCEHTTAGADALSGRQSEQPEPVTRGAQWQSAMLYGLGHAELAVPHHWAACGGAALY